MCVFLAEWSSDYGIPLIFLLLFLLYLRRFLLLLLMLLADWSDSVMIFIFVVEVRDFPRGVIVFNIFVLLKGSFDKMGCFLVKMWVVLTVVGGGRRVM